MPDKAPAEAASRLQAAATTMSCPLQAVAWEPFKQPDLTKGALREALLFGMDGDLLPNLESTGAFKTSETRIFPEALGPRPSLGPRSRRSPYPWHDRPPMAPLRRAAEMPHRSRSKRLCRSFLGPAGSASRRLRLLKGKNSREVSRLNSSAVASTPAEVAQSQGAARGHGPTEIGGRV